MSFTIAPGVLGLLCQANTRTEDYPEVIGDGDLSQMASQRRMLETLGFDVGHCDVYPALKTKEDVKRAYEAFWTYKVDGWWNMRHRLTALGICTDHEYLDALNGL